MDKKFLQCEFCPATFSQKSVLKRHYEAKHGQIPSGFKDLSDVKTFIHFEPGFKDGMAFGVFKIHRCKRAVSRLTIPITKGTKSGQLQVQFEAYKEAKKEILDKIKDLNFRAQN